MKRAVKMAETKKKLISAARKAFADHGYFDTSMDKLTAEVGLTRGALYHNFGDKKGLFAAVVDQIDSEMAEKAKTQAQDAGNIWDRLMEEARAYIRSALDPEIQRIVLLDGPSVLGDPSRWPSQNRCLQSTSQAVEQLIADGKIKHVDVEAISMLLNGAAMNAALWVAASQEPASALPKALDAMEGLFAGIRIEES
ncbi:Transposon Tn10 TetC protein [Thalassocella blandensis]|nr:Transposon Tn10 TetC protein [Thalassocella blandensis]